MNNGSYALSIAQQYPVEQFTLLTPMQTVTEIAEIHKPVMNVVQISTNLDDKEIYEQEKAREGYTDKYNKWHPPVAAKYALTKKGLNKLMRAAGIKIIGTRPIIPSTCQKCAEVNRSIGQPINCGHCACKDVAYEARISVPQLTGENIEIVGHKEIVIADVTADMSEKQKAEFMKFRNEMCETKAINRALRAAMHIKGTYTLEELRKPFVVAYLVPNLDHELVKQEAIKHFFTSAGELYGTSAQQLDAQTVQQPEYIESDQDAPPQIPAAPQQAALPDRMQNAQPVQYSAPQQQYAPQFQQQAQPQQAQYSQPPAAPPQSFQNAPQTMQGGTGNTCTDCGKPVSGGVLKWSMNNYGRPLCMDCQKKYGGN